MNLLNRFSSLSPVYQSGLTNHLPMMITALKEMNVFNLDIQTISEAYVESKGISDLHNSLSIKSEFEQKYISSTNTYINMINKNGVELIVGVFLSEFKYSLASGLFHGLIRLYYSLLTEDELQIAQALAFFHLMINDIKLQGEYSESITPFDKLLKYRMNEKIAFRNSSSMEKFDSLLDNLFIKENIFKLKDISSKEAELVELFTGEYLKTRDFYILHIITGFQALHSLKSYFINYDDVLNNFFLQAQIFMLLNDRSIEYVEYPVQEIDEIISEVAFMKDAHDIKLFYSCYQLSKEFNSDNLKKIAAHIVAKQKG